VPMNGRNKLGTVGVLTVLCALVAIGVWIESGIAAKAAAREATRTAKAEQKRTDAQLVRQSQENEKRFYTTVCERNNIVKAEARIAVHENKASPPSLVQRRDKLFVVLDCASTFEHGGRGVPLTPGEDKKYLDVIRRGRIPDLKFGQVVGSHEPEQGGLADF
jgi:hypothetical protein